MGIFSLVFLTLMAQALPRSEKFSYPEQRFLAKGVEKIQILGVNGHIKLTGRPGKSYRLKIRHSKNKVSQDWSLSVDRRGSTLVLEVSSAAYGAQWRAHVRKELWPDFDIQLEGPAKPTIVSWRAGEMDFVKWKAPVEASQVEGKVSVREGGGEYALQLGQSDLNVDGFAGSLTVKGERGQVRVAKVTGPVNLNWIAGGVEMKSIVGDGKVDATRGDLRLKAVTGRWVVNWADGKARVEDFSGSLKAEGQGTAWSIGGSAFREVEVKSGSGAVLWERNKGGARVFLTSTSGEISGLKLPPLIDPEGRKVSEFAIGKRPLAQVFIRTESGAIRFQQNYP